MSAPAVVSRGAMVAESGAWERLPESWRLVDLLPAAVKLEAGTVYVVDLVGALGQGDGFDAPGADVEVVETGTDSAEPWRYLVKSTTAPASVHVVVVPRDEGRTAGPWDGLAPRELLGAFRAFRSIVGVDWQHSVGRTAEVLILSTHPRAKGGTLLDRDPRCPEVVASGRLELPWAAWRRPLAADELVAWTEGYVHVFDANAQYLTAWAAAELGHGMPSYLEGRAARFDPARFGFWHFPGGLPDSAYLRPELPAPWLPGREWYATATVQRALEVADGLELEVPAAAWIWPNRSRYLRRAAEKLRDARSAARQAHAQARGRLAADVPVRDVEATLARCVSAETVAEAVKALYAMETGRFGAAMRGAGEPASAWYRPDWGHAIRATARVNLHRRLEKLGRAPFAIATDGLFFLDSEPDPSRFAARINLPVGDGLGQFKHDATVPAGHLPAEVLAEGKPVAIARAMRERVAA